MFNSIFGYTKQMIMGMRLNQKNIVRQLSNTTNTVINTSTQEREQQENTQAKTIVKTKRSTSKKSSPCKKKSVKFLIQCFNSYHDNEFKQYNIEPLPTPQEDNSISREEYIIMRKEKSDQLKAL